MVVQRNDAPVSGFRPPRAARAAAKRGLELRRKHKRGGTAVGVARARDLSNGRLLSRETVARMSQFARHLDQPERKHAKGPSARKIAVDLWGGRAGITWAKGVMRRLRGKR